MKPPWPRLTETLTGPKHPHACQSCTLAWRNGDGISYWLEHDESDQPEYRVVAACARCADELIEPHPRLYRRLARYEPMSGVMELCVDCVHRDGVRCACPAAKVNGGPGINVTFPKPESVHVCRSPRSKSGWVHYFPGPPTACSGREEASDDSR